MARSQHGLVTRAQAHEAGVGDSKIKRRVSEGRWSRARPGVYVIGAAEASWHQRIMAACLAGGPDIVASHRTALRLWGLVGAVGRPEVLVQGNRRLRLDGIQVHQSILLPPADCTVRSGIPTTTIARTLIDASARQDGEVVGSWVDRALREFGLDLLELRSCLARLAGPGRRNVRTISAALASRAGEYDPGDSELEARVLRALVDAGLPLPVQQHVVRRPDGRIARIDLAYPERQIAIEVDGWSVHGGRGAFDPDRVRGNDLTVLGWRLLRYTASMDAGTFARMVVRAYTSSPQIDPAGVTRTPGRI